MNKDTPQLPTPKEVHLTPEEIGGLVELEGGKTEEEWEELRRKYLNKGEYELVDDFREGKARVRKNGRYFFIKEDGTELTNPDQSNAEVWTMFPDGRTEVSGRRYEDARNFNNGRAAVKQSGQWFFIKEDGTELSSERYKDAGSFYEGRAWVKKDGKEFFIKEDGTELSSKRYDRASSFSTGRAWVDQNGQEFYIDLDGNRIQNP